MAKKTVAVMRAEKMVSDLQEKVRSSRLSIEYVRGQLNEYTKQADELHTILDSMGIAVHRDGYSRLPLSVRMFAWVLDMAGGKIERAEQ